MSDVNWLTQGAYDNLVAELEHREGPLRKEIARKIEVAREEGDLKENAGYHAAKDEQGHNEARVRELRAKLANAQVGAPDSQEDEVAHGKVVTVHIDLLDDEETFLLASRDEAPHSSIEVYSISSPLGAAINGKRVGDEASYEAPNGKTLTVKILRVEPYTG